MLPVSNTSVSPPQITAINSSEGKLFLVQIGNKGYSNDHVC